MAGRAALLTSPGRRWRWPCSCLSWPSRGRGVRSASCLPRR